MYKLNGNEYYILQKAVKNKSFFMKDDDNFNSRMGNALLNLSQLGYVKDYSLLNATANITKTGRAELKAANGYMIG